MIDKNKSHYEVIVIGAGVAGIYQIKLLADLGVDATVLDAAGDLGGPGTGTAIPEPGSTRRATLTASRFPRNC